MNCRYCADSIGGGRKGMRYHLTYCEWNTNNANLFSKHKDLGFFKRVLGI